MASSSTALRPLSRQHRRRASARARAAVVRPALAGAPVLLALGGALWCVGGGWAPTYAVKGAWQGEVGTALRGAVKGDLTTVLQGLHPEAELPEVGYSREGASLSVRDGRLTAGYTAKLDDQTELSLQVDEHKLWRGSLRDEDSALAVEGQGAEAGSIFWEASRRSRADGVGDVEVEFNSKREYNLTVERPHLATFKGAHLGAKVRASNDGIAGRLALVKRLPKGVQLSYSVENPAGVYDVGYSTHEAKLTGPLAGGDAQLSVEGDGGGRSYEASYLRILRVGALGLSLSHRGGAPGFNATYVRGLPTGVPADGRVELGADEDGVYGAVVASREVRGGLTAGYEASARLGQRERRLAHALTLSGELGYAQLAHGTGDAPRLRVGYEFAA